MNYTKLQFSLLLLFSCSVYGSDNGDIPEIKTIQNPSFSAIPNELNPYGVEVKKRPFGQRPSSDPTESRTWSEYFQSYVPSGKILTTSGIALLGAFRFAPKQATETLMRSAKLDNENKETAKLVGVFTIASLLGLGITKLWYDSNKLNEEMKTLKDHNNILATTIHGEQLNTAIAIKLMEQQIVTLAKQEEIVSQKVKEQADEIDKMENNINVINKHEHRQTYQKTLKSLKDNKKFYKNITDDLAVARDITSRLNCQTEPKEPIDQPEVARVATTKIPTLPKQLQPSVYSQCKKTAQRFLGQK